MTASMHIIPQILQDETMYVYRVDKSFSAAMSKHTTRTISQRITGNQNTYSCNALWLLQYEAAAYFKTYHRGKKPPSFCLMLISKQLMLHHLPALMLMRAFSS